MQLRYLQSLAQAVDGLQKISHLAWTPDKCGGLTLRARPAI